jgi:hypothetical protein
MGHTLGMSDSLAIQAFLAPLKRLAARHPGIEGQVLWAAEVDDGWQVQDDTADMLDAEEIPFYIEGLMVEGFGLIWQVMAEAAEGRRDPDHVLVMVWETGTPPPPAPTPAEGWVLLDSGRWDGAPPP